MDAFVQRLRHHLEDLLMNGKRLKNLAKAFGLPPDSSFPSRYRKALRDILHRPGVLEGCQLFQESLQIRYRMPSIYTPWEKILACLLSHVIEAEFDPKCKLENYLNLDLVLVIKFLVVSQFILEKYPVITIDPLLLEMLLETEPPTWGELPDILPGFLLALPQGYLTDPEGNFATFVLVLMRSLIHHQGKLPNRLRLTHVIEDHNIGTCLYLGSYYGYACRFSFRYFQDNAEEEEMASIDEDNPLTHLSDREQAFVQKLKDLVCQVLWILATEPQLVAPERVLSERRVGGRSHQEQRFISWRVPRHLEGPPVQTCSASGDTPDDSGLQRRTSPRPHWRRGHWHKVRYGPGKQKIKVMWFPPVLVRGILT